MQKGTFFKKHAIKTKYGFDRVVEDLIQEAMSKGDFDNLSGYGKPLTQWQSQNPYVDFTQHKINKILLDNGFSPEWIMLQKEIRYDVTALREALTAQRRTLGASVPLSQIDEEKWNHILNRYSIDVNSINKKIDKYNILVPILNNQMLRIDLAKIGPQILKEYSLDYREKNDKLKIEPKVANKLDDNKGFMSFFLSLFS